MLHPYISPVLSLFVEDNGAPVGSAATINFIGATVTSSGGVITVDVSAVSVGAWSLTGNAGAGNVLGTTTNDNFGFITNNFERGGWTAAGYFFIANHFYNKVQTTTVDASETILFSIQLDPDFVAIATVSVFARLKGVAADTATMSAFERKVAAYNAGAGAILQGPHTTFTSRQGNFTLDCYFKAVGNQIQVIVVGDVTDDFEWTGTVDWQLADSF